MIAVKFVLCSKSRHSALDQDTPFELFHMAVGRPMGGIGSRDNSSLGADAVKPLIAWATTQSGVSLAGDDRS